MAYSWFLAGWRSALYLVATSVLIYLSMMTGLRLGERRTLAEMSIYDFTVAIALGTILGRTATTQTPSYLQGLVATFALLATHNLLSVARVRLPIVRRIVDHRPLVLVRHGVVDQRSLRSAHLTQDDLNIALREHGVARVSDVALAVLEGRGSFSVIRDADVDEGEVPDSAPLTDSAMDA